MSNSIRILSIILITFSLIINFYSVYASDVNMNLVADEEMLVNETQNGISLISGADSNTKTQLPSDAESIASPSSVGAVAEEGLGLSNILSILLITVGVVLILLAIAIIIRLKWHSTTLFQIKNFYTLDLISRVFCFL